MLKPPPAGLRRAARARRSRARIWDERSIHRRRRPRARLAAALAKSPSLTRLFVAPGNPGCAARWPKTSRWRSTITRRSSISAARTRSASSSSAPRRRWSPGVADDLAAAGILCFGPSKAAARARRLEGLHQGFLPRVRHSDRRLSSLPRRGVGARLRPRPRARRSSSRPTASPPAKASSSP